MKKILFLGAILVASGMLAEDIPVNTAITNVTPVAVVRVGTIIIDIDTLLFTGESASNRPAITAPYRWVDGSGVVVRTGTARITAADMRAMLGDQAAQAEIDRFLGLLQAVVKGVVR